MPLASVFLTGDPKRGTEGTLWAQNRETAVIYFKVT